MVITCRPSFQDESTGEITFYMKGADVVMSGIVQYNDWLEEEVSLGWRLGGGSWESALQRQVGPAAGGDWVPVLTC